MTFRSRGFLDVQLAASGIKKPNLKSRAGLLRNRSGQLGLVIFGRQSCERLRELSAQSGAKAMASMTSATAETVIAIFLVTTSPMFR